MAGPLDPEKVKPDSSSSAPPLEDKRLRTNQLLLKKLREAALERDATDLDREALSGEQLHESVREWEVAKHSLKEIQQLLLQAYKDLEHMQPRR